MERRTRRGSRNRVTCFTKAALMCAIGMVTILSGCGHATENSVATLPQTQTTAVEAATTRDWTPDPSEMPPTTDLMGQTRLHPDAGTPPARRGHSMVYSTATGCAILFGGIGSTAPSTVHSGGAAVGSANDKVAKRLIRDAMGLIDSAFVDLQTFDPAVMTPDVLASIEPPITWIVSGGTVAITAPTARAAADAVEYSGTAATYTVGTVSDSGRTFGVVVDRGPGGGITHYIDGVAQAW